MLVSPQVDGVCIGTILVLEEEALVSVMIEDFLLDQGALEVLVCSNPEAAEVAVARRNVDCAILGVTLGASDSFGLADELDRRDVPFLFATATGPEAIVARHRHRPILAKPYSNDQLLEFMHAAVLAQREEPA
ncbi:response regulator [Devosia sp. A16]|uniref:response regulator n=1 Tax=Devosia sp. A16 TaxID=1736675 RepID=UPI000AEF8F49|nr:response regulator [Devosia sp. A16]